MGTLSEEMAILRKEGYMEDFSLRKSYLETDHSKHKLKPKEFVIDKAIHFDDFNDPSSDVTLYAISSKDCSIRGLLVQGFNNDTDAMDDEMLKTLQFRHQQHFSTEKGTNQMENQ